MSYNPAMATVKVTTVGNSLGITLPREMLERLRVDKGDLLYLVETPTGIELTPYEPVFAAQMEALERTARFERDLLRRLAQQDVSLHSRPHLSVDKPTDGVRCNDE